MDQLEQDLKEHFGKDVIEYIPAQQLYASLSNMKWAKDGEEFSFSWRTAGEVVSDIRNENIESEVNMDSCQICFKSKSEHVPEVREVFIFDKMISLTNFHCKNADTNFVPDTRGHEDYLDFYCSGDEGIVADWIEQKLSKLGYIKTPYEPKSS